MNITGIMMVGLCVCVCFSSGYLLILYGGGHSLHRNFPHKKCFHAVDEDGQFYKWNVTCISGGTSACRHRSSSFCLRTTAPVTVIFSASCLRTRTSLYCLMNFDESAEYSSATSIMQ